MVSSKIRVVHNNDVHVFLKNGRKVDEELQACISLDFLGVIRYATGTLRLGTAT